MTIAAIIRERDFDIITCTGDETVGDAITKLAGKRIGALPIVENGLVIGIFSERDIVYRLAEEGPDMVKKLVRDVMTSPAITVSPETEVMVALSLMTRRRIRHLPVVDGKTLAGFVSIGDLVKYRIDRIESEAEAMRAYIQT